MKSIVLFFVLTLILGVGTNIYISNSSGKKQAEEASSKINEEIEKIEESLELDSVKTLEIGI